MAYTEKQKLKPTNVKYTNKDFSSIKNSMSTLTTII